MNNPQNSEMSTNNQQILKDQLDNHCSGYLFLADIKDSTLRKKIDSLWAERTGVVYEEFSNFCISLKNDLNLDIPIIKYLGDGLMAFAKTPGGSHSIDEKVPNVKLTMDLIGKIFEFINLVHDNSDLSGLRLKVVFTYLTNLKIVNVGSNVDILGRGVDFSFRLEKFSDATHLTVNRMVYKAIEDSIGEYNNDSNSFDAIRVKKRIKGWDNADGEDFYLITNTKIIEDEISCIKPSPYDESAKYDLFFYYINKKSSMTQPNLVFNNLENESSSE